VKDIVCAEFDQKYRDIDIEVVEEMEEDFQPISGVCRS